MRSQYGAERRAQPPVECALAVQRPHQTRARCDGQRRVGQRPRVGVRPQFARRDGRREQPDRRLAPRPVRDGLAKSGIPLRHFVLHADPQTLAARIENDPEGVGIRRWRHDHIAPYTDALPWLREEGEIVETVDVAPDEVARRIAAAVA